MRPDLGQLSKVTSYLFDSQVLLSILIDRGLKLFSQPEGDSWTQQWI